MHTLVEQAAAITAREVSSRALVERALARVEALQAACNAFTAILADDALERAGQADQTPSAEPLHGVPVAVKDLYDVRGVPTTGCCAVYHDRVATRDAAAVEALRDAGAIVIAKTNQHELACGATSQVSSFGPVRNPWDTERIPGGSSGGSGAAVAAGVVTTALGSDTGGSIRMPSAFCGVTGLKPTHGAVSMRGAMPMTPSLDTAGPLAVSAADCLLVHRVIAGFDPDDPRSRDGRPLDPPEGLRGVRIALPRPWFHLVHPETKAAVEQAARVFEEAGAQLDETDSPDPEGARDIFIPLAFAEVAHHYRDLWDDDRVSPQIRFLIDLGRAVTGADLASAQDRALRQRRDFEWALTAADALLVPAVPFPAPKIGQSEVAVEGGSIDVESGGPSRFTLPVNLAGLPAVSFPVGFSSDGLPLGAQLVGRDWSEAFLCTVVDAYQQATDFHLRRAAV